MRYGDVTFEPEHGTITITKKKKQVVRHYIDTDRSDAINLGRQATEISCVVIARTDTERNTLEQIFHSDDEENLYYRDIYYKKVQVQAEHMQEPVTYSSGKIWKFNVKFIALDPVPYDATTDEAMY